MLVMTPGVLSSYHRCFTLKDYHIVRIEDDPGYGFVQECARDSRVLVRSGTHGYTEDKFDVQIRDPRFGDTLVTIIFGSLLSIKDSKPIFGKTVFEVPLKMLNEDVFDAQEIIENLYLGSARAAETFKITPQNNDQVAVAKGRGIDITHILRLMSKPPETNFIKSVSCKTISVTDGRKLNRQVYFSLLDEACDYIHMNRMRDDRVLVNCRYGVSRSSAVVIAYLMKYMGMNLDTAYKHVIEKRSMIFPNECFLNHLEAWYDTCKRAREHCSSSTAMKRKFIEVYKNPETGARCEEKEVVSDYGWLEKSSLPEPFVRAFEIWSNEVRAERTKFVIEEWDAYRSCKFSKSSVNEDGSWGVAITRSPQYAAFTEHFRAWKEHQSKVLEYEKKVTIARLYNEYWGNRLPNVKDFLTAEGDWVESCKEYPDGEWHKFIELFERWNAIRIKERRTKGSEGEE